MLLASANVIFQQWGLQGVIIALVLAASKAAWVLYWRKHDDVVLHALTIRASLINVFQRTILNESVRFFKMIEAALPSSLARASENPTNSSPFELLCKELKDFPDPTRHEMQRLMERALAGVIVSEVEQMFEIVRSTTDGELTAAGIAAALRITFEEQTETSLTLVATELAEANEREKKYYSSCKRSMLAVGAQIAVLALVMPCMFIDAEWVGFVGLGLLSMFSILVVAAVIFFIRSYLCQEWLRNASTQLATTEALQKRYAAAKAPPEKAED